MKATDLMIGDYVSQKESNLILKVSKVNPPYIEAEGEGGQFHENTLRAIPLTTEILETNGFFINQDKDESWYEIKIGEFGIIGITRFEDTVDWIIGYTDGTNLIEHLEVEYVHELQHALRLLRIEKEILL